MCRFTLILATDLNSCHAPVVITWIFTGTVNQQVRFLIYQVLPVKLAHLEIRCELNRVSRAGFLAITAENATGEVDAEELRKTPPGFVLGRLERDATDWTRDRAQVARDAALASVGIPRQNDPAPITWREIRLLFWILNGNPLLEGVKKNQPDRPKDTDHLLPHISTAAPVTSKFAKARGNITFQPHDMS